MPDLKLTQRVLVQNITRPDFWLLNLTGQTEGGKEDKLYVVALSWIQLIVILVILGVIFMKVVKHDRN